MIISVNNAKYNYPNSKTVFNDICFSVSDGDLLAILGPNGAGKTTLLKSIMGLLKLTSGNAEIDGQDISKMPYKKLFSTVSYVPQAKSTFSAFSVEEMVLLGRSAHFNAFSKPKQEDMDIINKIIDELHIDNIRYKKCSQISGGELQMVLIAKALATQPHILILDEPESNLDFKNQLLVLEILSKLTKSGMICIFNTHYPAHALQRANKALLLCKGGEYEFGDTAKIITEKSVEKAFGVQAVIGAVETSSSTFADILPIKVLESQDLQAEDDSNAIGVVSIISSNDEFSAKINEIIHQYMPYIVGRMGMPYRKKGLNIINLTLDAPKSVLKEITLKLSQLDVSIKMTYEPLGKGR